jgi:hypothetical protein
MQALLTIATIFSLTASFSDVNERFLHLQQTIDVMLLALGCTLVEAANFAVRYCPTIKRYYQRKRAKTNTAVAIRTVAHKLARACYYIRRDHMPFALNKTFG